MRERVSEWVCVCLPVRNVFVWVCAVFWEVASLQLTIIVHHLEKRKTILLGINECEQNHLCEVFWFTPYCGSQKITILPLVTISYSWKYEWNARDTFFYGTVFFFIYLFDSIVNFATCTWMHLQVNTDMFWAVVSSRHQWAHLMWCTNR